GNVGNGIYNLNSSSNVIQGNYVGTDVSGNLALGNDNDGIFFHDSFDNTVGGTAPGAGNLLSGNGQNGIRLNDVGTTGNVIQGNLIGTDASGKAALGNAQAGINVSNASDNSIGGATPGAGNTIAFNTKQGVYAYGPGTGNEIASNKIFSNAELGIDLGVASTVTPNDPQDTDSGTNNLQNFPVISSATSDFDTRVQGTLNSEPSTTYTLEFFANSVADGSGYGEGEIPLGTTVVTTDGVGDASFDKTLTTPTPIGWVVTATATDPNGNTSEFSAAAPVTAPATFPDLSVASLTHSPTDPTTHDEIAFTAAVTNLGDASATPSTMSFAVGADTEDFVVPSDTWTHLFGSVGAEYGAGLAVDETGIYQAGYTDNALPGQVKSTPGGEWEAFIRKYDYDGNELWMDEVVAGEGIAVAVDTSGVYMVGQAGNNLPGQPHFGNYDAFIRKYDRAGNEIWT
ncbi:MAG: hypothetical protein KAJ37_01950, partial [Candidatus Krumholzibacteria bacterium]|nr:hypothetical protein [Candidatus Krumholzibacteria bacterium]